MSFFEPPPANIIFARPRRIRHADNTPPPPALRHTPFSFIFFQAFFQPFRSQMPPCFSFSFHALSHCHAEIFATIDDTPMPLISRHSHTIRRDLFRFHFIEIKS